MCFYTTSTTNRTLLRTPAIGLMIRYFSSEQPDSKRLFSLMANVMLAL